MTTRVLFGMIVLGLALSASTARAQDEAEQPRPGDDEPARPPRVEASFGRGVEVETADGDFALGLGARVQLLATVLAPEHVEGAPPEDASVDATVRRLRLTIEGHALDEALTYKIQLGFSARDQGREVPSPLYDAFVAWTPVRDLALRVGQAKVPFGRQPVVSSGSLQMVDRSIVASELGLDRDVGITAFSDDLGGLDEWLGYSVGVFGGDGRNRVVSGSGLLYAARLEVRPLGGAPELAEPDLERSATPRLAFGVSAAFDDTTDRERGTHGGVYATGPWVGLVHGAVDWRFKWRGLSVTNELMLREATDATNTAIVDGARVIDVARTGVGGFVQAGQMLTEHLEIAARYGSLVGTGEDGGGFPDERELGGAISAYVREHALKVQADYFYLFDEPGEGAHQIRVQLQIAP